MRDTGAMLSRPLRALVIGVAASAAALLLALTPAIERVELATVDQRFAWRGAQAPPPDVLLVAIGPDAIGRYGGWPLPRRLHARAIARLLDAGARAVAYDVQFTEPSDRPAGDRALLEVAADPRVVLGTVQAAPDGTLAVLGGARRLQRRGGRVGHALFPVDADGVWRRFEPTFEGAPQLSALAAGAALDGDARPIDFAGPPGTVRSLPFEDLLAGRFATDLVRDRIVVVGVTDVALNDVATVPTGGQMAGAEIHAHAIQTVLDGYPLRELSPLLGALLVLGAGLVAPLASLPGGPTRAVLQALAAGVVAAAALLAGAQVAFDAGTIVPLAAPLLALAFGTAGAVALTYAVELRARRRVRHAFERFVAPEVVGEILAHDGDGAGGLASRRLVATVLFCDLRGFTTLAERLEAEQVIAALNRYLELVSGAIFAQGGTVVSYQGDGVLAVFGAPLERPDHAAAGLAAARAILDDALPAFNRWLLDAELASEPLHVGIGLNTGPVMSGSVGSTRRIEYAAVGDATNVAARLQALGRELPGRLFASDTTVAALDGAADGLRRHGEVALKGRREPVGVWVEA